MPVGSDPFARRQLRVVLFEEQGGLCCWCGHKMTIAAKGSMRQDYATFEHITPKADGGTDDRSNLKLAHRKCNHARGQAMVLGKPWPPVAPEARP